MVYPQTTDKIGKVKTMLGNDRILIVCQDGTEMLGRIRGKIRKRVWIRVGDIILISPWDFEPNKGDIFYRYTKEQVKLLKRRGLLPKEFYKLKFN